MKILALIILAFTANNLFAENPNKLIREGNKLYEENKFADAELKYQKSMELDNEDIFKAKFNLADALYKQEKFDEAAKLFNDLTFLTDDKELKSSAYHNLGNSLLQSQKLEESLAAYKEALKNNPKDNDARYNYEYVKKLLDKEQQQQDQNNQDNKDNKDDEKEENKDKQDQDNKDKSDENKDKDEKNQQNQDEKNSEENKDKQDQQQQQKDKGEQNDEQKEQNAQQQKEQKISPEDAQRILNALMSKEKELLKEMKKQQGKRTNTEKNW